ncbi:helical backbone metal receptor [Undibacterium cyanobacteriorum]|uniref:Helical backbone metal receptor n=1 Tax=Undibacterium cyanobacteriorum TaxID=3073561 RepID=A0ABY9RGV5_9BURK|nr:helical backbone metal receptor [Undibacterium sp. 20NA77.5]WMW80432.1 helical backbone metal receptor [Undibacterium sp. 20NA77.5]
MTNFDNDLMDSVGAVHRQVDPISTPRIVCLVPSITELLCELGLARWIVGRTGFCIHPKSVVQSIPKVGGTKDVNVEKIRKLEPTHLIVNIDENEKPTVDVLAEFIPHIIVTHPNHPRDNLHLFRLLGTIFRQRERALVLCDQLQQALDGFEQTSAHESLRVMYGIWRDPWMTVSRDTYIAQMLALRGWQQCGVPSDLRRYPSFEWEQIDLNQVDLILLSTEPYSFTQADANALSVKLAKPVVLVDGEMLSWYGSRVIPGLRYLKRLKAP